jgi:hypothetical protein
MTTYDPWDQAERRRVTSSAFFARIRSLDSAGPTELATAYHRDSTPLRDGIQARCLPSLYPSLRRRETRFRGAETKAPNGSLKSN